jgi:hypothetical protein
MENLWHWIIVHWKSWGINGIVAGASSIITWVLARRREWNEDRQSKAESRIDSKVLHAIGSRELWKGSRAMTGAGIPAVRSAEIAVVLRLDEEVVADSLERLEMRGRVSKDGGTLDDPRPIWLFVPR